jgi:O-antigen ligase
MSWLGVPRFDWSLTLLGLCIFTIAVVTARFPFAEVGIAIAAAGLVLQGGKVRFPAPVWLYALFVLWAFVASLSSQYADIASAQVIERLKLLVIMIIIVNALQTQGQLRFYLLVFLACYMVYPARGTLQGYAMGYNLFGRAVWNYIYSNSNDLATLSLLALGIALAIASSWPSRTAARIAAGVSAIVLLVVILLTQSRGAFLGLVAGMGPAFLGLGLRRPGRMLLYAGVAAVVIGLSVPAAVWERLSGITMLTSTSTIALADPEGSAEQRFAIMKTAWQIFRDHPVFGVGLGAYPEANAIYAPHLGRRDTHNTFLNLAAELGLPGLVIWCALVWSVLGYAYRTRKLAAAGDLATQQAWLERALWAYLVASLFGTYAKLSFPYMMLAVLWCSANLLATSSGGAHTAVPKTKA